MAAAAAAAAEAKVCSSIQVGAHQTGEPFFFLFFTFMQCEGQPPSRE
jgi:hypothetical protein